MVLHVATIALSASFAWSEGQSGSLLDWIGARKGICVLPGDEACRVAIELAGQTDLLFYVQLADREQADSARRAADRAGLYGTRIFVGAGPLDRLHLGNAIADAVVVPGRTPEVSLRECLRVLRPQGRVVLGGKVVTKPFPKGIDDWSHPYHGPDNNPQSEDTVAVAPYLTQFLADPRYAPVPQVAVASAGRVFKAYGHVAFKRREEPLLNKLVAYNGYNGTMLWQRDLREGVMIHRNTLIATPQVVYLGDDKSCKVIDAATGRLIEEIVPPMEVAGGTFWKWMALEDGVLYAVIGQQEQKDPTMRWGRTLHGWPWNPISKGFNQSEHPWGFGRNVLAIDVKTKHILWHYHEDEPADGRAICMKNGRIYLFRFGSYLTCLDAKVGSVIWRKTPQTGSALFKSLGRYLHRQDWRTNWRTACYLKCSDKALYFAGPPIGKLLAVSAEDGRILWEHPYDNFQLVLQGDILYALSGQIDKRPSVKLAALTGEVLAELDTRRRACTRPTGGADAIFFRAQGGSVRLDLSAWHAGWISPMRPNCHDGVTIANGLLYWWPSVCDCQLTLYGFTALGPAGDFDFAPAVTEANRLEKAVSITDVAELPEWPGDWPSFRADNRCSATSAAVLPRDVRLQWRYDPGLKAAPGAPWPSAPTAVGGLAFIGAPDGVIRAIDIETGRLRWRAYTGGPVRIPPTIWKGRAFVGSGDGWVYAFEAKTGRLLWRFRAAPEAQRIPVYGLLMSRWPAASGVLVDHGTAYVAAGIVNYDGTYVYALDAVTGRVKWQNNSSGHLDKQARTGISVQGHFLLHKDKLYLAGGTSLSPGIYETKTGKCLNDPGLLATCVSHAPRGWELSLLGDRVIACGKPFYAHPRYDVFDATVFGKVFLAPVGDKDVIWAAAQDNKKLLCYDRIDRTLLSRKIPAEAGLVQLNWAQFGVKRRPVWSFDCREGIAFAVCSNAVVVAGRSRIVAVDLADGRVLWSQPLPARPVVWGVAIDGKGRILVSLEDGRVVCFGQPAPALADAGIRAGRRGSRGRSEKDQR